MFDFLFDVAQESRINHANQRAQDAVEKTHENRERSVSLRRRVEVMTLANQALFEILKDRLGISEEEVLYRMAEIDGRDGNNDGKIGAKVVACRRCGRKVSTARQRCMYCAEVVVDGHLYEKS